LAAAHVDVDADSTGRPEAPADELGDEQLSLVLAGLPDAVVGAARDERIVFANDLAGELFGYPPAELLGRPIQALWPARLRERYTENMRLYFATEHPLRFTDTAYGLRSDGSEFVGEMSWGIVESGIGPVLFAIGRDVSAQRRRARQSVALAALSERALAGAELRELAEQAVDAMRDTLHVEHAEIRRLAPPEVLASWGSPAGAALSVTIRAGREAFGTIELAPAPDDVDDTFVRATANVLGLAAGRLRDEAQMRHRALHDPLTGVANRTLLSDRIAHALARVERGGTAAVLFVDLDAFKRVNDLHGHHAGDGVLAALAARLASAVRPADTVARVGGDEFVVLCEDLDARSARALGERLEAAVRAPVVVEGVEHALTASVGVALAADATVTPAQLLAEADAVAYRAKAAGGARVAVSPRT
jgi:diguanylate cyclase (GGDEF)-like protein/PAS domain S-box-containing protein